MMFPDFDPVAFWIGPLAIRWYALAYIVGILLAWRYCIHLAQKPPQRVTRTQLDDLMFWVTIGIIVGGRLGQVLLWEPGYYFSHPLEILMIWHGGMAFHGGLIGVILAIWLYARSQKLSLFAFADIVAPSAPIGLFLGRIANFINGELVGRPTDVPWAVIFPQVDMQPRHPSQLYQATFEGILLFSLLVVVWKFTDGRRRPGLITGTFCIGYAVARIVGEIFREPDSFLGFILGSDWLTMGMLLSLPVLAFGGWLVWRAYRKPLLPA